MHHDQDDQAVAGHPARIPPEGRAKSARRKLSAWAQRQAKRDRIVRTALLGAQKRALIHYSQVFRQRMSGVDRKIRPPAVPPYEDCSSFATWLYWEAGAPDPNGLNYNGSGYTGTQITHGHEVSVAAKADLVFYGSSRTHITHVAVCVKGGPDAEVVSHGSEGGPYGGTPPLGIDYRSDRQMIRRYL